MMTKGELINTVLGKCYKTYKRIYVDPTSMGGRSMTRVKLLGARIEDVELRGLQRELEGKVLSDGKRIERIAKNVYSDGGSYTSKDDICIYLV